MKNQTGTNESSSKSKEIGKEKEKIHFCIKVGKLPNMWHMQYCALCTEDKGDEGMVVSSVNPISNYGSVGPWPLLLFFIYYIQLPPSSSLVHLFVYILLLQLLTILFSADIFCFLIPLLLPLLPLLSYLQATSVNNPAS